MGGDMMKSMEASIGIQGMSGMAEGMKGMQGMQEIGKAMSGMSGMTEALSTAFTSPEVGITGAMSGSIGMISQAVSGKATKEKSAAAQGT